MAADRSAGLTEWSRFDVPGMWSLLRNVSTVDAFRQAGAWQSTYEAAQSLARRLEWYRDGLAGKWSPDGSDAAALYLGRLDELIGSAQQLADVSVANRQALVTLANAVDEARPKLQRVYEESEAMRQLGAQAKAGASVVRRQQQLHTQATEIMESLGSAAMDSWRHYATADDYQPPFVTDPSHEKIVPEQVGEGFVTGSSTSPTNNRLNAYSASVDHENPYFEGVSRGNAAGATARNPASPPTLARGSTSAYAGEGSPPHGFELGALNQNAIAVPWAQGAIFAPAHDIDVSRRSSFSRYAAADDSFSSERPGLRAGVIGGGTAIGPEASLPERTASANRIGGVIGGESTGFGAMGLNSPGLGSSTSESRGQRRQYDVAEDWAISRGVSPVIAPPPDPVEFDPGPGVIGLNR